MKVLCGLFLCLIAVVSMCAQSATTTTAKTASDLKQQIKTLKQRERYRVEYSKSKTEVYVDMPHLIPGKRRSDGDVFFAGNFRFDGKELKENAEAFELIFTSTSRDDGDRFLTNRLLIVLVDGVRIDFGQGTRRSYVVNPGGSEMAAGRGSPNESGSRPFGQEELRFKANREQIEKMGNGKQVEFLLGDFPAVMTDESKQTLRNLLLLGQK